MPLPQSVRQAKRNAVAAAGTTVTATGGLRHAMLHCIPLIMARRFASLFDKSAIGLSGLCLLHCFAGWLAVTVFTVSGGWLGHDIHAIGLALALPIAGVALWRGVASHGRAGIGWAGAAGLLLMAASLFAGHGSAELPLSIAGVVILGLAHWWNMRAAA